jgi:circadian clock protein KaiB
MGLFGGSKKPFRFRFYTTGESAHTEKIMEAVRIVLDEKISGLYDLEFINVLFKEKVAKTDGVFMTPTLAKIEPPPIQKLFGSLGDVENLRQELAFLDEEKAKLPPPPTA